MDVICGCPPPKAKKKDKLDPVAELQLQGALAKLKRGRNTLPPKVITPDMFAPGPVAEKEEKVPFKRIRVMHTTTPRTTPRPHDGEVIIATVRFNSRRRRELLEFAFLV